MGTDEVLFNGATYTLNQFGKREREEGREGGREEEREGGRERGRKRGREEGREGEGEGGGEGREKIRELNASICTVGKGIKQFVTHKFYSLV